MPRNNLSLLRRTANRGDRPVSTDSGPPSPLPMSARFRRTTSEEEQDAIAAAAEPLACSKLFFSRADLDVDWMPTNGAVLKLLFSLRLTSALWSGISDCDEVFNYWEPMHLLVYGDGLQTWEYSPLYAIRSWLYIWLHAAPGKLIGLIFPHSKIAVWVTMRCGIASLMALADFVMFKVVASRLGVSIARFYLVISMFSAGMFISSSAFIPSSFAMAFNTISMAALYSGQMLVSTLCVAVASLVGWPFSALLGAPTVITYLFSLRRPDRFILHSLIALLLVATPLLVVDTWYYGKRVMAPLNIVMYNIFSTHGPDLYGTEPLSYYLKNLALNWNIASLLWLAALPLGAVVSALVFPIHKTAKRIMGMPVSPSFYRRLFPVALTILSIGLWFTVFFTQAHKEERFLFPVFPLLALLTAITLDALNRLSSHFSLPSPSYWLLGLFILLSTSRAYSLHRNYSGTIDTYKAFADYLSDNHQNFDFSIRNDPLSVCVGKEWHRFPSSFFLPNAVDAQGRVRPMRLRFLRSEFRGLLPKYFPDGRFPSRTRAIPTEMNDANKEETTRYVPLDTCDWVVDLETPERTALEPNYGKEHANILRPIIRNSFLLAHRSHWLLRAFFVPFLSERNCEFGQYTIYERVPPTVVTKRRSHSAEEEERAARHEEL
ncbi:algn-9 [Pristionchus pacificus]|nr:algn-9 [Pristionchus pacificus]